MRDHAGNAEWADEAAWSASEGEALAQWWIGALVRGLITGNVWVVVSGLLLIRRGIVALALALVLVSVLVLISCMVID